MFCKHYEECCSFYSNTLELPTLFTVDDPAEPIHCFAFGESYLMVERDSSAAPNLNKFRLNVENIEETKKSLTQKNVDYTEKTSPWGTVLELIDPDGNSISIRDEDTFALQLEH